MTSEALRIEVTGAPEGGFSLYGAMYAGWSLLIAAMAATMLSIPILISERFEYMAISYSLAFAAWCWWIIVRPRRKQARLSAYGRSLGEIRSALRTLRGGAHRARYFWLGVNLIAAAAAATAARAASGPYADALGFLAILLLLNGLRLWSDKSNSLKTLGAWGLIAVVWLGLLSIWGANFADRPQQDDWVATLSVVVLVSLMGVAAFITRRIAPWSQATMQEMRARDPRAPVLFIRSFNDEAEPILRNGGPSLERVLTDTVRPYGPFIGIGRPGELRPAGAARQYFPDDQWRAEVLKLMDEAAFIVVVPGLTAGLDWEMQRIGESGRLRKTIFVLPNTERAERFARLCSVLAQTPEGARLAQADLSAALSLHLTRDWRWAIASSGYVSYAEYQAAVEIAVFGLLCVDA